MFRRRTVEQLRIALAAVDGEISEHPFSSPRVQAAQALTDAMHGQDSSKIDAELKRNALPSTEELGRITLTGMRSWAKLHRSKQKLEKRIAAQK